MSLWGDLNTWEKNIWLKVVKVGEEGRLMGHLINSKSKDIIEDASKIISMFECC